MGCILTAFFRCEMLKKSGNFSVFSVYMPYSLGSKHDTAQALKRQ